MTEANAALPRLELLVERLQRCALRLEGTRRAAGEARGAAPASAWGAESLRAVPGLCALVEDLVATVQEIECGGARLQDVTLGAVDFPALIDGAPGVLCWQFGERRVAFWHRDGEGVAGRRPLPGIAESRVLQ